MALVTTGIHGRAAVLDVEKNSPQPATDRKPLPKSNNSTTDEYLYTPMWLLPCVRRKIVNPKFKVAKNNKTFAIITA